MLSRIKQYILSSLLVATFFFYTIYYRTNDTKQIPTDLAAPNQLPMPITPMMGTYKDGEFTSDSIDAFYGNVQLKVSIAQGRITNVKWLDYPKVHKHSLFLNTFTLPTLRTEAIQAQSANVDIVSGATATSEGFRQAMTSALALAKK
ncbi:MAG: FMN-binding protein [bacterium]|nr:FMN-binding protein [bacterium]